MLHDRRIPRSRANIDHLAVAPSGVWVVDTKRYKGRIRVAKPLFGEAKLVVAGRDRTKLVDGLLRQLELVRPVVEAVLPSAPVRGALCFVEGDLPLLGTLEIRGFPLLHRRSLAKRINAPGPLGADEIASISAALARGFPAA